MEPVTLPQPIFAGFFPKRTRPAPPELNHPAVTEIASVSCCISEGPEGWIDAWLHNAFGFYDTEELARRVLGDDPARFDLYAYELFPLCCLDGRVEMLHLDNQAGPLPEDYEFLGYDIVTRSTGSFFECSPLSCNLAAAEYPVNRFCLIDDPRRAYQALLDICRAGSYEPGPYYLAAIYRQRS